MKKFLVLVLLATMRMSGCNNSNPPIATLSSETTHSITENIEVEHVIYENVTTFESVTTGWK